MREQHGLRDGRRQALLLRGGEQLRRVPGRHGLAAPASSAIWTTPASRWRALPRPTNAQRALKHEGQPLLTRRVGLHSAARGAARVPISLLVTSSLAGPSGRSLGRSLAGALAEPWLEPWPEPSSPPEWPSVSRAAFFGRSLFGGGLLGLGLLALLTCRRRAWRGRCRRGDRGSTGTPPHG